VPSGAYAGSPPGIGFEPKDDPLWRDINLLGRMPGRPLVEQEDEDLFETEKEEVRPTSSGATIGCGVNTSQHRTTLPNAPRLRAPQELRFGAANAAECARTEVCRPRYDGPCGGASGVRT
jgi:hypothetical protein